MESHPQNPELGKWLMKKLIFYRHTTHFMIRISKV